MNEDAPKSAEDAVKKLRAQLLDLCAFNKRKSRPALMRQAATAFEDIIQHATITVMQPAFARNDRDGLTVATAPGENADDRIIHPDAGRHPRG